MRIYSTTLCGQEVDDGQYKNRINVNLSHPPTWFLTSIFTLSYRITNDYIEILNSEVGTRIWSVLR